MLYVTDFIRGRRRYVGSVDERRESKSSTRVRGSPEVADANVHPPTRARCGSETTMRFEWMWRVDVSTVCAALNAPDIFVMDNNDRTFVESEEVSVVREDNARIGAQNCPEGEINVF
jgi:ferredoxin